ncbi:thioredoxin family protein [Candidatus Omnitrophota bacterium]
MLKSKVFIWLSAILLSVIVIKSVLSEEGACPLTANKSYVKLNNDCYEAQVLESNDPLLVLFYADWCPYSGSLLPIYKTIEDEYSKDIKFCRFQLGDEYKDFETEEGKTRWGFLKEKYDVSVLPTLVMFNTGKELDRMSGRPEKEIVASYYMLFRKWIDSNLIEPQEDPYLFEGTLLPHKK